jgi:threonine dehydrogenase-like Zn-dependent dehydrogenase
MAQMGDVLERYRAARDPLPETMFAWQVLGQGMDNFGINKAPVRVPLLKPGPGEVLLRVDAIGICFSDVKVIAQGSQHPRIFGRDLVREPVVPGHECALTVVAVGEGMESEYRVGERFVIQADVYYRGKPITYGYVLWGGMAEYSLVGDPVLRGDEGSYLIPVSPDAGYAETALTEPWACVVHAYRLQQRRTLKAGGIAAAIGEHAAAALKRAVSALAESERPARVITAKSAQEVASLLKSGGIAGVEDLLMVDPTPDDIEACEPLLARGGVAAVGCAKSLSRPVSLDIGRVHYDSVQHLGCRGGDPIAAYSQGRDSELSPGGCAWIIGAAGPIGQMHVRRALQIPNGPSVILATDIDDERLAILKARCADLPRKDVRLVLLNVASIQPDELARAISDATGGRGFDEIVVLAPSPAVTEQASAFLAPGGVLNIFAGVARGTMAKIDYGLICSGCRIYGSSGSRTRDLVDTVRMAASGEISPNQSVAAIGGIAAMWDGVAAVKEGRVTGRVVIFPQIENFPLTELPALRFCLPSVHNLLGPGETWTKEAEEELLRIMLPSREAR